MELFILGDRELSSRVRMWGKAAKEEGFSVSYYTDVPHHTLLNKVARRLWVYKKIATADLILFAHGMMLLDVFLVVALLQKKLVVDFYISYYDMWVLDRKAIKENSVAAKRFWWEDRLRIKYSQKLLFLNKSEAEYFCEVVDLDAKQFETKIEILPVCRPRKPIAKLPYWNKKAKIANVVWVGTYIPLHGLDKIISAMALLKQRNVPVKFWIWGTFPEKFKPFGEQIKQLGIEDICIVHNGWVGETEERDECSYFMEEYCDINMGIFGDSQKAKTVLANKVMEGIAYKIPTITAKSKGVEEYFTNDQILIINNTAEDIANAVQQLLEYPLEKVRKMTEAAFSVYAEHFDDGVFSRIAKNTLRSSVDNAVVN